MHRVGARGRYVVMASPYNTLVNVSASVKMCRHSHRSVRVQVLGLQAYSTETPRPAPGGTPWVPENMVPLSLRFSGVPLTCRAADEFASLRASRRAIEAAAPGGARGLRATEVPLRPPACSLKAAGDTGAPGPAVSGGAALLPGEGGSVRGSGCFDDNPMARVTRVVRLAGVGADEASSGIFAVQRLPRSKLLIPKAGRLGGRREFSEAWISNVLDKEAQEGEEPGDEPALEPRAPADELQGGDNDDGVARAGSGGGEIGGRARRGGSITMDRLGAAGDFEVLSLYDLPDSNVPVAFQWAWPEVVPDELQVRLALDLTLGRVVDRRKRRLEGADEVQVTLQSARRVRLPPMELSVRFPAAPVLPPLPESPKIDEREVLTRMGVDHGVRKTAQRVLAEAEAAARGEELPPLEEPTAAAAAAPQPVAVPALAEAEDEFKPIRACGCCVFGGLGGGSACVCGRASMRCVPCIFWAAVGLRRLKTDPTSLRPPNRLYSAAQAPALALVQHHRHVTLTRSQPRPPVRRGRTRGQAGAVGAAAAAAGCHRRGRGRGPRGTRGRATVHAPGAAPLRVSNAGRRRGSRAWQQQHQDGRRGAAAARAGKGAAAGFGDAWQARQHRRPGFPSHAATRGHAWPQP